MSGSAQDQQDQTPTISPCCLRGFAWNGTPTGSETTLGANAAYATGPADSSAAILLIHDLFGWTFPNIRLLADYYAENVGARVYVPDFFGGQVFDAKALMSGDWSSLDIPTFRARNSRENRRAEILACARQLRGQYTRLGAVGFCFGGWAVMELGSDSYNTPAGAGGCLVDCIATAHPSWLTREDIDRLAVPVQIQAPEVDSQFTPELKEYANRVIPTLGVEYEYLWFAGVEHAFATRGDSVDARSRRAMRRSMHAAVAWFRLWLKPEEDGEGLEVR